MDALVTPSLEPLIEALRSVGYTVVGPTVKDGAVRMAEIWSAEELPAGVGDAQEPGGYRLTERDDDMVFGFAAGPDSAKRYTQPPRQTLFRMRDQEIEEVEPEAPRVALLGVRACDLAAIAVQDRVFLGRHPDSAYRRRREALFLVAVNCAVPGGTCFCASMGTGPKATAGFDLAITELAAPHRFLIEPGSERGAQILTAIPHRAAEEDDLAAAQEVSRTAATRMGRQVDTTGIQDWLPAAHDHPRWTDVASRCLSCTNCTMACPTCFCSTVEDITDLSGDVAERSERWDSCFTLDFTELGGTPVRGSALARYRQWLTHKFATWYDQFGVSGCVGCGRCITWCPTGIDVTEELSCIR
ncbi:4Fe-4S dicluster domain-containing protein [Streptosporangium sp. NBC_01755]|uniref:4Fe-4S dicluster domain-containing protein n=1 Tax=unclassified Streptosporangium TaxID=2632669 RepID=UPI002DD8A11D|nr:MULTISPECIES: 4Fe-4S dicluster domain-containing protein [unclassified Streptosporangium]WSA25179.1 4Fe-4S dicluster domain-containing protein [Streptosporangium sp. NBC_01810]WSD03481.1 4Fe-4S dicluster domain-containing protein [Streptosporangium sp. NBC_01755]